MSEKATRPRLSLRKKFLFAVLVIASALLGAEVGMRLCGYRPRSVKGVSRGLVAGEHVPDAFEYYAICDQWLGFRNRANGSFHSPRIEGNPLSTTDELGFRNGFGWSAEGESPIVLFVGDSLIFGSEVTDGHTAPSQVARVLADEFDVRVLNAAVRGYGTLQSKRMLIECLERFPQIKVVAYTHCGNDYEENIVPNLRYPTKAPVLMRDEPTARYREVEVSDPAIPFGEEYLGWRTRPDYPGTGGKMMKWLGDHSALCHYAFAGMRRIEWGLQLDDEFPDGKHVVPPSDHERWHEWALRNGGDEALEQLLVEMNDICREHGAAFVATSGFNGYDTAVLEQFASNCAVAEVEYVDLKKTFTGDTHAYCSRCVDGSIDAHYNLQGTRAYAAALAPALRRILRSRGLARRK